MNGVNQTTDLITDAANAFWSSIGAFVPALLGAILLIVAGALVAKIAETVITKVLRLAGVDKLKDNKKVAQTLKDTGVKFDIVNIVGRVAFWIVIIIFAMAAVDVLGLSAMREVINELLAYLPNVLAAVVVLTVTIAGARLLREAITIALKQMSVDYAGIVGSFAHWAIIVFGSIMTIDQLGFDTTIITTNVTVVVAGVMLGLALAFGLGGKNQAEEVLKDLRNKSKKSKK
jgi:hypothetical protein